MTKIAIRNLTKLYGRRPALREFSLNANAGEVIGLLGPNGCGKSTLMKIMAGLISDYQGSVLINGQKPGINSKSVIAYLPEVTYISPWMKPAQMIRLMADFYEDFDNRKAEELLQRFRLDPFQTVKTMSKGMQEKLQLALVMSRQAEIYLLDEPMSGVDSATRSAILDLVIENYRKDAVMILATHLIQDVERIFDRAVMLGFGEVVLDDSIAGIREKYGKSVDDVFREVFKCSLSL